VNFGLAHEELKSKIKVEIYLPESLCNNIYLAVRDWYYLVLQIDNIFKYIGGRTSRFSSRSKAIFLAKNLPQFAQSSN
jgi:hypothetical protein